jgi:hypothetical protein
MPRIRSVKPEYWLDRKLARGVSRDARLLYIGLWNYADEHGRLHGDPAVIKGQVFPYDDIAVTPLLEELKMLGRVQEYIFEGDPYLFLPKLAHHQRLEPAKAKSRLPDPPEPGSEPDMPSSEGHSEKTVAESAPIAAESEPIVVQQVASGRLQVASGKEHVAGSRVGGKPPALCADSTPQQRAEPITRAYYDALNGMCKWPAVLDIVKRALKSGRWSDQTVSDAVMRLAGEGRPLTVDSLRIECDGLPARASPNKATQRTSENLALVRRLQAQEQSS